MKNKNLIVLIMASLFTFSVTLFNAYVSPYLLESGFSESLIAFILSLGSVAIFISSPVIGYLSDILGRKKVLVTFLTVLASSVVLYLLIPGSGSIVLAIVAGTLHLSSAMAIEIVLLSMLEDGASDKGRGYVTGIFQSMRGIGSFLGPIVASWIVLVLPISGLFKISLIFIFFILGLTVLVHEKHFSHKIKKEDLNFIKDLIIFWKNKKLRAMGIMGMTMHVAEKFTLVFMPLFVINDLALALSWVGIVTGFKYLFKLPEFFYGKLADKFGSGRLVFWGGFIKSVGAILFALSGNVATLLAFLAISSVGGGMWNTSAWSYMSEIGEREHDEGRVVGSYISLTSLASFASMIFAGFFVSYFGTRGMFAIVGTVALLGVLYTSKTILSVGDKTP